MTMTPAGDQRPTLLVPHGLAESLAQSLRAEAQSALSKAEREVNEAEEALRIIAEQLDSEVDVDAHQQQRLWRRRWETRNRRRQKALQMIAVLEHGYLPIPRIPAVRISWANTLIPPEALQVLAEAKQSGLFQYFALVNGDESTSGHYPAGGRHSKRDPILVGVLGGEIFPLAWWR